jgi:hypothetical protein
MLDVVRLLRRGRAWAASALGRLLVVAALVAEARAAGAAPSVAEARAAFDAQRYPETRVLVDTLLLSGNHSRDELIEIYLLRGELEAVMSGPEAGEAEFRKLLVLDPGHAAPALTTPVFMIPFNRAQRWVEAHGQLSLVCGVTLGMGPPGAQTVEIASDPLKLVRGLRVSIRGAPFRPLAGPPFRLPPVASADYFVEAIDAAGSVVATCGNGDGPRKLGAAPVSEPSVRGVAPRVAQRGSARRHLAWILPLSAVVITGAALALYFGLRSTGCAATDPTCFDFR